MRFESSGSSKDIHEQSRNEKILGYRTDALEGIAIINKMAAHELSETDFARAEEMARSVLLSLAQSFHWAEGMELENECHEILDRTGRWVRENFGCFLELQDGVYFETCPVALAHDSWGFSIGGTALRICTLCGLDISECEHLRDTAYLVPGGSEDLGWCRVCLSEGACEHSPNETYRAAVIAKITELKIDEVSWVRKPANPETRALKTSIPTSVLMNSLGDGFQVGMDVSCDKCLRPCPGIK